MMDDHNKEKPNILELRSTRPSALEQLDGAWLQVADPDLTRKVMDEEADKQGVAKFEGDLLPFCFPSFFGKRGSCAWSPVAARTRRFIALCPSRLPLLTGLPCRSRSPGFEFFAFSADEYNVLARCKFKYNPFFEQERYLPAIGRRALLTFRGTAVEILGDHSNLELRDQWQRRLRKQYAYITCGTHGCSVLEESKSSE
jgi:hypothetical protein